MLFDLRWATHVVGKIPHLYNLSKASAKQILVLLAYWCPLQQGKIPYLPLFLVYNLEIFECVHFFRTAYIPLFQPTYDIKSEGIPEEPFYDPIFQADLQKSHVTSPGLFLCSLESTRSAVELTIFSTASGERQRKKKGGKNTGKT